MSGATTMKVQVLQNATLERWSLSRSRSRSFEDGSIGNFIDSLKLSTDLSSNSSGTEVELAAARAAALERSGKCHHPKKNHHHSHHHNHQHKKNMIPDLARNPTGVYGKSDDSGEESPRIHSRGMSFAAITESLSASSEDISDALGKTFGLYKATASTALAGSSHNDSEDCDEGFECPEEYDSVEDSIVFERSASTDDEGEMIYGNVMKNNGIVGQGGPSSNENNGGGSEANGGGSKNGLAEIWNAVASRTEYYLNKKMNKKGKRGSFGRDGKGKNRHRPGTPPGAHHTISAGEAPSFDELGQTFQRQLGIPMNFKRTPSERTQDILTRIATEVSGGSQDGDDNKCGGRRDEMPLPVVELQMRSSMMEGGGGGNSHDDSSANWGDAEDEGGDHDDDDDRTRELSLFDVAEEKSACLEQEDSGDDDECGEGEGDDVEGGDGININEVGIDEELTMLEGIGFLEDEPEEEEDADCFHSVGSKTSCGDDDDDEDDDDDDDYELDEDEDEFGVEAGLLKLSGLIYRVGTCRRVGGDGEDVIDEPAERDFPAKTAEALQALIEGKFGDHVRNYTAATRRGRSDTPRTPGQSQSFHTAFVNQSSSDDDDDDDDDTRIGIVTMLDNPTTAGRPAADSAPSTGAAISGGGGGGEEDAILQSPRGSQHRTGSRNPYQGLWQTMFGCGRQ